MDHFENYTNHFMKYSFEHLICVSESCFLFTIPTQNKIKNYHFGTLTIHSLDMNNHT